MTPWSILCPTENFGPYSKIGPAIEVGLAASAIAEDVELRLLPLTPEIGKVITARSRVSRAGNCDGDRIIRPTTGRRSRDPELTERSHGFARRRGFVLAVHDAID